MKDSINTIIRHALFWPLASLFLIILLIVFAGPYIAFAGYIPLASWGMRIAIVVTMVLVFCLFKYIQYLKSLAKQDKLVDELVQQHDASESINAEQKSLNHKFSTAIASLKTNKKGGKTITQMPWFMIIGAPGSGKTTLFANSGLEFPLSNQGSGRQDSTTNNGGVLQGVGGTKNCDWWISKDAVLLDTAGRYTSQDSYKEVDESAWFNFLKLIKKYRKKPISGLIVSLSMTDLIGSNDYELGQKIHQLQQRILEINTYYKTRFPVYIVITKTDLLAGFSQYFESFSHVEREQPFGLTFSQHRSIESNIETEFTQKYTALCDAVSRRKWARMSIQRDDAKKGLLYLFGEQLASLQPVLQRIISQLSSAEGATQGYYGKGLIRGLYFTSGTQSGAPIDRMANRVSQVLGLQINQKVAWNNEQRSYFIKDILEKVMLKEADLLGTLSVFDKRMYLLKNTFYGLSILLTILVCFGFYKSSENNIHFLDTAEASVISWEKRFSDISQNVTRESNVQSSSVASIKQHLPALNELLNIKNGLLNFQDAHFSSLGLSQTHSIDNAIDGAYQRMLSSQVQPFIKLQLESLMVHSNSLATQYQALKVYLMMGEDTFRDNDFISNFIIRYLNSNIVGQSLFINVEFQQLVRHLDIFIKSNAGIGTIDSNLVEHIRKTLNTQALSDVYYQQFKDEFTAQDANYYSMFQLAGAEWNKVFSTDLNDTQTIPYFFSHDFLNNHFKNRLQEYINKLNNEKWVLKNKNILDVQAIQQQIENNYVNDYINSWQGLLLSTAIKSSSRLTDVSSNLQVFSQTDSPIFLLLNSVSQATNFTLIPQLKTNNIAQQFITQNIDDELKQLNSHAMKAKISARFESLHALLQPERRVVTEQSFVSLVQDANIRLSFKIQNQQPVLPSTSPLIPIEQAIKSFGFLQPEPLKRWMMELSAVLSNMQNILKKDTLNTLWVSQILPQCQSITNNKYPFKKASKIDASLLELKQIFAQTGSVMSFFDSHLSTFVIKQTSPWQWKPGVQSRFNFAPGVLAFFEQSANIQKSLFSTGTSTLNISLSITPVFLDSRLTRMDMSIYGTALEYKFGRSVPTAVNWPPINPSMTSDIRFVRRDGSEVSTVKSGLFALTRLLDQGSIKQLSPSRAEVNLKIDDFETIFEMTAPRPVDPIIFNRLSDFTCLSGL